MSIHPAGDWIRVYGALIRRINRSASVDVLRETNTAIQMHTSDPTYDYLYDVLDGELR